MYCALQLRSGVSIYFLHGAGCQNLHSSPVISCQQDFFCKHCKLCCIVFAVAFVLRSDVHQLLLLLLPCLLGLADEFRVRYNDFFFFVFLPMRLAFLRCCEFSILFYFPLLSRWYRLGRVCFFCWYHLCSNP